MSADHQTVGGSSPGSSAPRCLGCRYLLVGLTANRCPECGRSFNPDDPATFDDGNGFLPSLTSALFRPPGWITHSLVMLCALVFLIDASVPGNLLGFEIELPFIVGMAVVLSWGLRAAMAAFTACCVRRNRLRDRGTVLRWVGVPVITLGAWLVLDLQLPLRLTFLLSVRDMNRVARQVIATPGIPTPTRIGLYRVGRIEVIPGGMRFVVGGPGMFGDSEGFAYSPAGPPARLGEDYYRHFHGHWYRWTESW